MLQLSGTPGRALALVLTTALATFLAGCYTVIKHPRTKEVVDGGENRRDCYSCHGPGGTAQAYDPLYTPGFDHYPDVWYGYYAYPWWYRDYWQDDLYGHGGGSTGGFDSGVDDDSRRHMWGRGTSYSPPALPPVLGNAPSPTPPGQPQGGSPPTPEPQQQPGRTMKEKESGPNPPDDPPGNPPPTPAPTPKPPGGRGDKKEDSKKDTPPPPKGEQDKKDDGSR